MKTTPLWQTNLETRHFPALDRNLHVDVLIVGGGITGVTAAFLLSRAGRKVALIERGTIGGGESGHTTAHLTYVMDTRLPQLVKTFGRDHARAAWDAGAFAMQNIEDTVKEEGIACDLRRVPGYLVAASGAGEAEARGLSEEATLAAELGFDAAYTDSAPVFGRPAIGFANQLKFHPLKYIASLAQRVDSSGSQVFENTVAEDFSESPRQVVANGNRISFDQAILATHVPIQGNHGTISAALLQTKLAAYSTYAIGTRLREPPPEALFWDTANPYFHLRIDGDYVILGGADHKTGQEANTAARYRQLEDTLHLLWPEAQVAHRWSGQVIETSDGLPFIGETAERQWVATGFAGNGMTFGTLAAYMIRDALLGVRNPWTDLLSVHRKELSSAWDYLKENKDYPYYLVKNAFASAPDSGLETVGKNDGRILLLDGKKVAVHRDASGVLTSLSPVCPHLGCMVAWNGAEKTWDCPCHGSRFGATGEVIAGPAEKALSHERGSMPGARPLAPRAPSGARASR